MNETSAAGPVLQPEKSSGLERVVSDHIEPYYSGCAMVVSSPVEISLYFGRYVLKGLDRGAPSLAQVYEKQVYMTAEEAEKLAQAILQTARMFKSKRAELQTGAQDSSGRQDRKTGTGSTESVPAATELIKV
ncbi:MAG: hypothetical protein WCG29_04020 [Desulfomonile sp.]|jgi:hypothetical protein|nr:hypothetical protein [Deltaproteobacteria bacterium]